MPPLPLQNKVAVVTGGGSGIGRAIAAALSEQGAILLLLGRNASRMDSVAQHFPSSKVYCLQCDLAQDDAHDIVRRFPATIGSIDILVHSAGFVSTAPLASVSMEDLDYHYRVNVRAPVSLTQALLPQLTDAHGQIVFINSSVGIRAKERVGAYAATKHALKAVADTLRMEINRSGVRVLSVFPGNTATPMQQQVCAALATPYVPEKLLQPADVAAVVVNALLLPRTAEVTDLHIRPLKK